MNTDTELIKPNGDLQHAQPPDDAAIMKLVTDGDCSKLTAPQLTTYYNYRCQSVGLDPACTPFALIKLNGKLVMYALKSCSEQLTSNRKLDVEIVEQKTEVGIRIVRAKVTAPDGRSGEDIGCVSIEGKRGDDLANALMKSVTKAKRRAVLSFCGLGMLDETELETIPGAGGATGRVQRATKAKMDTLADRLQDTPQSRDVAPGRNAAVEHRESVECSVTSAEAGGSIAGQQQGAAPPAQHAAPAFNPDSEPLTDFGTPQGANAYKQKLALFAAAKATIGAESYYRVLGILGVEHANELGNFRLMDEALAEMREVAKRQKKQVKK